MKVVAMISDVTNMGMANTNCALKYLESLEIKGIKVDIITLNKNSDDIILNNKRKVYLLDNYKNIECRKHKKKCFNELTYFNKFYIKTKARIKALFIKNTKNFEYDFIDNKNLLEIFRKEKYDVIISFSEPFAIHLWAYNVLKKMKNIRWYPVFLDPYVYNYNCRGYGSVKRKNLAKKVLSLANTIFTTTGIKNENVKKNFLPKYMSKIIEISYPNFRLEEHKFIKNNNNEINFLYTGMFHELVRNPKKLINILNTLSFEKKIMLTWAGYGCENEVDKLSNPMIELRRLGKIQKTEVESLIDNTDFLINFGNSVTNQIPSKVFEYISYGKPIINFYQEEEDISLTYFNKYPLCLNINVNNLCNDEINKIKEFVIQNKNKFLDKQTLSKIYSSLLFPKCCENFVKVIINEKKNYNISSSND